MTEGNDTSKEGGFQRSNSAQPENKESQVQSSHKKSGHEGSNGKLISAGNASWTVPIANGGNDSDSSSNENGGADAKTFISEPLLPDFLREKPPQKKVVKKKHILEKAVYVISVVSVVLMAYGVLAIHWVLPYYYSVSTPILLIIRTVMYTKYKWQYFLIDFCYFGNAMTYVYIWACPGCEKYSVVLFAVANGPLAWATWMFRNSLVFHDYDRMTSVYIHCLPLFVTYSIRWYSETVGEHWYQPFPTEWNEDIGFMFIWLVAVPMGCFIFHSILYMLVVNVVCKPGDEYLNSFRYLTTGRGWQGKMIDLCGKKYHFLMYIFYNWLYAILSLLMSIVWYKYFIAHTIYLIVIMMIVAWNGASFYIDVFSVKGFKAENV